tara:strand:- start:2162 stop:2416 length:255 start_codon:yes stop_codon:yes gene_type:complete
MFFVQFQSWLGITITRTSPFGGGDAIASASSSREIILLTKGETFIVPSGIILAARSWVNGFISLGSTIALDAEKPQKSANSPSL